MSARHKNGTSYDGTAARNSYAYDSRDRLTNKTVVWTGWPAKKLNYLYDADGNLTNLVSSTSGGVSNCFQLDPLNRLTTVLANASAAATYAYDGVGNLQALRYGNGVTNLYQYDVLNRLTNALWKANAATLASFYYQLGWTGNRTNLNEYVNGTGRTNSWTFDSLYRLTKETFSGGTSGSLTYGLDLVGNRQSLTTNGVIGSLTNQAFIFNPNDWQTNTDAYDANGNTLWTTNDAVATGPYSYDPLNHLTNLNNAVLIWYDGDGSRVKKTTSTSTNYYLLDDRNPSGYVQVLEEWTVAGATTNLSRVYNYGLALISQRQMPSGAVSYFGADGHGSTRFLADANGSISDTYTYDAYGNLIASSNNTPNHYLYCGQQWDPDLGQYYLRARTYNPTTGRFWTMDTAEGNNQDPPSLHKYLYCAGNPADGIDPNGHDGDLISTLVATAINAGLTSMAISAPFRAYQAVKRFQAGVNLGTLVYDFTMGELMDGAVGAVLPGLLGASSRIVPIARVIQVGGQFVGRAANSVWNLIPVARGRLIEQSILGRLPSTLAAGIKNFPVIDDFMNGVATSIKSIGLTDKTYQVAAALKNKIVSEAVKLSQFKGAVRGTIKITEGQIDKRVLVVVMEEEGAATPAQANAIIEAIQQSSIDAPFVQVVLQFIP